MKKLRQLRQKKKVSTPKKLPENKSSSQKSENVSQKRVTVTQKSDTKWKICEEILVIKTFLVCLSCLSCLTFFRCLTFFLWLSFCPVYNILRLKKNNIIVPFFIS